MENDSLDSASNGLTLRSNSCVLFVRLRGIGGLFRTICFYLVLGYIVLDLFIYNKNETDHILLNKFTRLFWLAHVLWFELPLSRPENYLLAQTLHGLSFGGSIVCAVQIFLVMVYLNPDYIKDFATSNSISVPLAWTINCIQVFFPMLITAVDVWLNHLEIADAHRLLRRRPYTSAVAFFKFAWFCVTSAAVFCWAQWIVGGEYSMEVVYMYTTKDDKFPIPQSIGYMSSVIVAATVWIGIVMTWRRPEEDDGYDRFTIAPSYLSQGEKEPLLGRIIDDVERNNAFTGHSPLDTGPPSSYMQSSTSSRSSHSSQGSRKSSSHRRKDRSTSRKGRSAKHRQLATAVSPRDRGDGMSAAVTVDGGADLEALLVADDLRVVSAVCQLISPDDPVIASLAVTFESHDLTLKLIEHEISREVDAAASVDVLFRDRSIASKLFEAYTKLAGMTYLQHALQKSVLEFLEDKELIEVDPSKLPSPVDVERNLERLRNCVGLFVEDIIRSFEALPITYRILCNYVSTVTGQRFPGKNTKAVGCFLFLHLYCPAVIYPEKYGLLPADHPGVTRRQRRGLILVSKTLFYLALGEGFEEAEANMVPMNTFIAQKVDSAHKFVVNVCAVPRDAQTTPPIQLSQERVTVALEEIRQFLSTRLDNIGEFLMVD